MTVPQTVMTDTYAQLYGTYLSIRKQTQGICTPLCTEDYTLQPITFVSPPKWHLAHTTWFFEEFVLKKYMPNYCVYHPNFGYLFNSYYNVAGDRVVRSNRGNMTRPQVKEIYDYRAYVDKHMRILLDKGPITQEEVVSLIVLGLNHEQQHQELLLTDLKYIFGHNPLFPVYCKDFSLVEQYNKQVDEITVAEGIYEIGAELEGFCWDNELGRHKVYIQAFEMCQALVTNGEYLEFINDKGYERFDLWLDEGWNWVNENAIRSPLYWHQIDHQWYYYTFGGLKKIDPKAILCHISFYEAAAFAEWKKMRLPTEFEWEVASERIPWGLRWEWANSAYLPYPGFEKVSGAIGEYNGKFMVNQMVLRGASTATPTKHSRKTYRNFSHPHSQWQCTGIRLVKK